MFLQSPPVITIWGTPWRPCWDQEVSRPLAAHALLCCTAPTSKLAFSGMLPQHQSPANITTDPPALRGALPGGRARRRRTPCCSAAHSRSPTPDCSCLVTSGLAAGPWCWVGRGDRFPFRQQPQAAPEPYPGVLRSGDTRKGTLAALDVWSDSSPCRPSSFRPRREKDPGCAGPKETQSRSAQVGALSTQTPPPPPPPRCSLRSRDGC